MNSDNASNAAHPELGARAEAAAWLARLRGPYRTPEVEQGFRRWLQASSEHRRAFELLTERLETVEQMRAHPQSQRWRRSANPARTIWPNVLAVAAALVLVTLAVVIYPQFAGVSTAVGEQRTLTLTDGSRVYLNTNTRMVVHYDEHSRRVELKSGEALFEVARDASRPFVVVAGEQQITALGTTFVVRHEPQALSVTLVEGKVAVTRQAVAPAIDLEPTILEPGQRLIVKPDEPPRLDEPPLEKITAWRQGQVAIEDMPLAQAAAEMNRYSTVKLVVADPGAADLRVGGFFRMGDSASFARAVAITYGLQVVERSDEIVLAGVSQTQGSGVIPEP